MDFILGIIVGSLLGAFLMLILFGEVNNNGGNNDKQ